MKKKFKITIEAECDYHHLAKETVALNKAFNKWLKDWSYCHVSGLAPVLYTNTKEAGEENSASAKVKVKIVSGKFKHEKEFSKKE